MSAHIYKLGTTTTATLTVLPTLHLVLSAVSGNFYKDDLLVDANAGHGYVVSWDSTTSELVIVQTSGTFTTDGLTDSTSSATATIDSIAGDYDLLGITSLTPASVLTAVFNAVDYKLGDTVNVTVTFDRPITVTNTPRVGINVNGTTRYATYASGTGTAALVFTYTPVVAGDTGIPGTVALISPLNLNTTGTLKDATAVNATLAYVVPSTPLVAIDGQVPVAPILTGITNGHTYLNGDSVTVIATYAEKVNVTGVPYIVLNFNATPKNAAYVSGTGTTALTFTYTPVTTGDDATAGQFSTANAITLNSGTIKDLAGNNATVTGLTPPTTTTVVSAGTLPTLTGVTTTNNHHYVNLDSIDLTATFNKAVVVAGGVPQITLNITSGNKNATYLSGSGTTALVFRYTPVVAGDIAINGGVTTGAVIQPMGATILDIYGQAPVGLAFTPPATNTVTIN
jgi:hypothetical protein